MAKTVIVDTTILVSLVARNDPNHFWTRSQTRQLPSPWYTCESVLSETLFIAGKRWSENVLDFLREHLIVVQFDLGTETDSVLALMQKYRDVPMSLADACLVRMTEILSDPILLTTDSDFRVYRRNNRQVVPCLYPSDFSKTRQRRRR